MNFQLRLRTNPARQSSSKELELASHGVGGESNGLLLASDGRQDDSANLLLPSRRRQELDPEPSRAAEELVMASNAALDTPSNLDGTASSCSGLYHGVECVGGREVRLDGGGEGRDGGEGVRCREHMTEGSDGVYAWDSDRRPWGEERREKREDWYQP